MPFWRSCLPLPVPLTAAALYLYHREKELDEYERLLFSDDYEDDDYDDEDSTTYENHPLRPRRGEGVKILKASPRGKPFCHHNPAGHRPDGVRLLAMPYCHGENTICVNCCFGL